MSAARSVAVVVGSAAGMAANRAQCPTAASQAREPGPAALPEQAPRGLPAPGQERASAAASTPSYLLVRVQLEPAQSPRLQASQPASIQPERAGSQLYRLWESRETP